MKKQLLTILSLSAMTITGFSQMVGTSIFEKDDNEKLTGFYIEFYDAADDSTGVGYWAPDGYAPVVNETDEVLEITYPDSTAFGWDLGFQVYTYDDASAFVPFNITTGNAKASMIVEVLDTVVYVFKLEIHNSTSIEVKDTIVTLNKPVKITYDMATLATSAIPITTEFNKFTFFFYDKDEANGKSEVIKIHSIGFGTKESSVIAPSTAIEEGIETPSFDNALEAAVKVEEINILGQVVKEASSLAGLGLNGKVAIVRATLADGSKVIGKVAQ